MRKISKDNKILVAMSGGVDSSVTAALLVDQGYDVTGAYMVNFDSQDNDIYEDGDLNLECWRGDYRDAVRVAAHLDIELIRMDFREEYQKFVLDYMFKEYKSGRTPNPDVLCNKFVKFDSWIREAKDRGFDMLATGHYASVSKEGGKYHLMQAKDQNKDQTYFLHQLNQDQLAFSLFPLGEYIKDEVRDMAKEYKLPTANKEESMGVCFVGEVPMQEFLENKIEHKPGDIVKSESKEVLGQHDGLTFYTIGQRQGLDLPGGHDPLYVVDKDFENNQLIVGHKDDPLLYNEQIELEDINWISGHEPEFPLMCSVRYRHRQSLQECNISKANGNIVVDFDQKQRAVAPGQFAVFYKDGECFGGGVIAN